MVFSLKPADRPQTVAWFETLSILVLVADLIFGSGLAWDALRWVPLMLWIIFSISRRQGSIARWIFTGFYAFGFIAGAYGLTTGMIELADVTPAAWALTFASILQLWLLWSPDTSRWIASRRAGGAKLAA